MIKGFNIFLTAAGLNLLFEIFEDETFEVIFNRFRVLDILQKSLGRFRDHVSKMKEFTDSDKFEYLEDSLINLEAFIDYRLYDTYIN